MLFNLELVAQLTIIKILVVALRVTRRLEGRAVVGLTGEPRATSELVGRVATALALGLVAERERAFDDRARRFLGAGVALVFEQPARREE